MSLAGKISKNKDFFKFSYALLLMALIPFLIIFNTVFIVNKYGDTLDISLQQRALSVARTIAVLVKADLSWEFFIQHRLDELARANVGLKSVAILKPEADGSFKVVASSLAEAIGRFVDGSFYRDAWQSPIYDGLASDAIEFYSHPEGAAAEPGRFWLTAMPVSDDQGEKQALLVIELSASMIDAAALKHKQVAAIIVALTVLLVVMFLSIIFRLWDYAALYKQLKDIENLKSEFVSMASHELRTPITAINGFAQMLYNGEMGPINAKAKDSLKMMLSAGERLAQLVDDLLDVGRIEQGRIAYRPARVNPDKIIRQTVEFFSWQAADKGLKLDYYPHAVRLPELFIDRDRFKQVLFNLVSNAIKYSPAGSIQIITRVIYNGQVLEICVKDSGIGLSEDELARLFEKFYRARNDKAGKVSGTGLGLWISKQLVELMGGKIVVESIEDVGTQFILRFPVAKT